MSWQTPKTDWSPSQEQGIAGADLNRIEGNTLHHWQNSFDISGSLSYLGSYVDGAATRPTGSQALTLTGDGLLVQSTVRNVRAGNKLYLSRTAIMLANSGARLRVVGKMVVNAIEVVKTWDSPGLTEEYGPDFILADNTMVSSGKCRIYIYIRPNSGSAGTITIGDSWRLRIEEQ